MRAVFKSFSVRGPLADGLSGDSSSWQDAPRSRGFGMFTQLQNFKLLFKGFHRSGLIYHSRNY